MTNDMAYEITSNYTKYSSADIENVLSRYAEENAMLVGCGVWFEPYVFDENSEYFGPYSAKKEEEKAKITYEYSTKEYNYFAQEYYSIGDTSPNEAVFTQPYFDSLLSKIITSCSQTIYDSNGNKIGAVTMDICIADIQDIVSGIQICDTGNAMLITADGTYLYANDLPDLDGTQQIQTTSNQSLAAIAPELINGYEGEMAYKDSTGKYEVYYHTLDLNGWKLIIRIPVDELYHEIGVMKTTLIVMSVAGLIVLGLIVIIFVRVLVKQINMIKGFSEKLSEGDFTISPLKLTTQNELGVMGDALNEMYKNNKGIIFRIADESNIISTSSNELRDKTSELHHWSLLEGSVSEEMRKSLACMTASNWK